MLVKNTMPICFLLLAAVMAPSASAAVCPLSTALTTYTASGFSCTVGDKLFSNFSYTPSGTNQIAASAITVDTLGPGADADIFSTDIGLQFAAPWQVFQGQTMDSLIVFEVSVVAGTPMLIEDASIVQSNSGVGGTGSITVNEGLCAPAPCTPVGSLSTVDGPGVTKLTDHVTFAPTGSVMASKDIGLNGGNTAGSFASVSAIQDTFSQTPVPEPVSILLFGTCLLAVAPVLRRHLT